MKYALLSLLVGTFSCLLVAGDQSSWDTDNRPAPPFTQGAAMFEKVKGLLEHEYYRTDLDESALYRAAVQGLLHNADAAMAPWNQLLTPAELAEVKSDLAGQIVGVGVQISFEPESGHAKVLSVIPDSPGEKAGLRAGDRILDVDGKFYRGRTLRDVVYAIRGRAGETRRLSVLRDAELLHLKVRLSAVSYAAAESEQLSGGIGWVSVHYFAEATPQLLRKALEKLKGSRALVIDLRGNEGGRLESAIESAGLLLPNDSPVVTLHKRGGQDETLRTKGEPVVSGVPLAVLVNESTASGAEILASALREDGGAVLFGAPTKGKGSVQRIDELPNGYAVKFTIATFTTPKGLNFAGRGLSPDIKTASDAAAPAGGEKWEQDAVLRAAVHWLRSK